MADDALREKVKEILLELGVFSGQREITMEEMAILQGQQTGLARIMPEIGQRTWKLFYAAKEGHWDLANFQYSEITELMELGAYARPKHEEALNQFMAEDWPSVGEAIKNKDFEAFEAAFHKAIEQANAYHELKDRPYIRWQLPSVPPEDLELKPRGGAK